MKKLTTLLLATVLLAAVFATPALAAPAMQLKLIVSGYALDGDAMAPGATASLQVTVRNTHDRIGARNITLSASNADGALLCQGRNQWYVAQIAAGKTAEITLSLKAAEGAAAGIHALALEIGYEDAKGMPGTLSATVPVEVRPPVEEPQLRADTPEALAVDAADPVTVKLAAHNLGKGMLYNLTATAAGQGLTLVRDAYAGNLDSGKSADIELTLAFDKSIAEAVKKSDAWKTAQPGDPTPTLAVPAQVTLSYEDADGKSYTQTVNFVAQANIPRPQEPSFSVPTMQQTATVTKQDPTGWVVAAVALVIAAVAIVLSLWSRRRRAAR